MEDYLKEALDIVKSQASVRNMNEDEITSMVRKLTVSLQEISTGQFGEDEAAGEDQAPTMDPKKAIREKSIVCLETGKSYKIITRKHLANLGITPEEYREKYGYKKGTPLVCKALQRERRKKMNEMQLWEKRRKPSTQEGAQAGAKAGAELSPKATRGGARASAKPSSQASAKTGTKGSAGTK